MLPPGLSKILKEAEIILEKDVIHPHFHTMSSAEAFESCCTLLLEAFQKSAEFRFYEAAYTLMYPLYFWFAQKRIEETGISQTAQKLTDRMMVILCEHVLMPRTELRSEDMLSWCYCLVENLIQHEIFGNSENQKAAASASSYASIAPTEMDPWLWARNLSTQSRLEIRVAESLLTNDANLLPEEKKALLFYYKNGMSITALASEMNMEYDLALALLKQSHNKALNYICRKEWSHLWHENIEEQAHD